MMKKILRPIGVLLSVIATKLVIYKHKPTVYVVTGTGETSLVRESLYTGIKGLKPTRRNLEKPEAEFSVPLTIWGEFSYPKNLINWIRVFSTTLLRILYLKSYNHTLILEINSINSKILEKWLPIISPINIFVIGEISITNQVLNKNIININYNNDVLSDITNQVADFVSSKYTVSKPEIINKLNSSFTPTSRINFAKSKCGNIVIDASYYQFAPQIKSIEEIIEVFPGPKKIIGNVPKSWKNNEFVLSLPIINKFEDANKEDILLLVGNRKDVINLRKDLFI